MDNLIKNELCSHHLDHLQFFECYRMFLNHFFLVDQGNFSMNHNIIAFYLYSWKKKSLVTFSMNLMFKCSKSIYFFENLDQLENLNIGFVPALLF